MVQLKALLDFLLVFRLNFVDLEPSPSYALSKIGLEFRVSQFSRFEAPQIQTGFTNR